MINLVSNNIIENKINGILNKWSERSYIMNSKEDSKILLDQMKSNNKEQILDCTKEIEEYMEKVIPKED